MSRKVIDLSVWNSSSTINWKTLKKDIDGVILRIGFRGYGIGVLKTDTKFREYANNCVKYDIPFGVYWFAQEITEKESKETAQYIANILKDYKLSYPVYYDVEYSGAKNNTGRADKLSKYMRTKCTVAFCEEIKKFGYVSGVYANEEWYKNMLDYDKIKNYSIWCARWNSDSGEPETPPKIQYNLWQYTSKGKVSSISGNVDISLELSAIIDDNSNDKSITDLALEVIAGKWGVGEEREKALTSMGYNYDSIQKTVNSILANEQTQIFKIGDKVKLKSNAVYSNNIPVPQWIKNKVLYVRSIKKETDNIVVSTLKTGNITGTVNKKYLKKL